jgi:hypothetical protein
MQSLTEAVFRLSPPGGLFDDSVVRTLFPSASQGARKQLVHRALEHREVIRLKPGLYVLAPDYRKSQPHPFVVASLLHAPSHVSLESALSYHGLIPEAVFQVSSVTVDRSRSFRTPLGNFQFYRVPCAHPRAGVVAEKLNDDAWAFVASPLRSIADLVYLRKEISWRNGLQFLTESMRIDEEDLRTLPLAELDEVSDAIRDRRTARYLKQLGKELTI